ncbi:MAG: hypothetical protein R3E87_18380 [Burkholderiaceae bacterium]
MDGLRRALSNAATVQFDGGDEDYYFVDPPAMAIVGASFPHW